MSRKRAKLGFYPPSTPAISDYMAVGEGHRIHYEVFGSPAGIPVLFLHGGPGGGIGADYHRYFDPELYRIVLFDQRGCGKSTPLGSVRANTTWHLVDDIDRLRQLLCVDQWVLFGGSWGSSLALAYAQKCPSSVRFLILRGVFLLRPEELWWFYQSGAHMIHPEEWERFIAPIRPEERGDMMGAYHRLLFGEDQGVALQAARAWTRWEKATCRLLPSIVEVERAEDDDYALTFARIENHYFVNGGFFQPSNQLLVNMQILRDIPGVIVQGRYDLVCPMVSAYQVSRKWPASRLIVLPDCGHSGLEESMIRKLVEVTDDYAHSHG